jgi:hypothetical protein
MGVQILIGVPPQSKTACTRFSARHPLGGQKFWMFFGNKPQAIAMRLQPCSSPILLKIVATADSSVAAAVHVSHKEHIACQSLGTLTRWEHNNQIARYTLGPVFFGLARKTHTPVGTITCMVDSIIAHGALLTNIL